ncbi:unnamed protein product [Vitrella brassicaformis CCMP3155]|uniref:Phospholipid/glycerol acyltransferase domain-containing protein n=2 Tax=Vitrella brassicaformis TaxID=1169539 RepID=A0A0G4EVZ5_VITBC|nr:unnamed protein product [Vitrella brassicaformis CCMP3155]|mmetsp:Transcript_49584/g.124321  ORF Transcript_49584/g.124321 Transcript_49584/m.124321 type:complete len:353 (+) Transcript_49584:107-1165(+)|eukprot:CEM02495.1 unnamed protein product [Vitrella brassicaformis CCMP3155]
MEKYRQFADPGTGVNPFVPTWTHYKPSRVAKALKLLIASPIAILRLANLLVLALLVALSSAVVYLVPIGVLQYWLGWLVISSGCSVAMRMVGLFWISETAADHRRLKLRPPKDEGPPPFSLPRATHGTLVLANHTSFIDVLYLTMRINPSYAITHADDTLSLVGCFTALRWAMATHHSAKSGPYTSVKDVCEAARRRGYGPVVLFPEGGRSNGTVVLPWRTKVFDRCGDDWLAKDTMLVCLEYPKQPTLFSAYTPPHTVNSPLWHTVRLCLQLYHSLSVTAVSREDVSTALANRPLVEQTELLRTLSVRMLVGGTAVEVPASTLPAFVEYWNSTQKRQYVKKGDRQGDRKRR